MNMAVFDGHLFPIGKLNANINEYGPHVVHADNNGSARPYYTETVAVQGDVISPNNDVAMVVSREDILGTGTQFTG